MRKKVHFLFLFLLANLIILGANAQVLLQEGFEGTFPPSGWTLTNNGTGNSWTQNTTATYAYAGSKSMMYGYNATNAADAWAFTPALSLTKTPVLITFYLRVRSATYPESFQLTIGNDTVVANHTNVLLDSTAIKNTVFQKWEVTYTPSSAGTYYLGFNCYSAANMWNVYVDNFTVQALSSCSGKPNAGIASGPSAVCSGQTINVSDSGATFGTGILYQWQNSIDNGATWTDISGATTSSYSTSLTDTTLFRYVTTCSNTGDTAISNVVKVGLNGVLVCAYCSPNNGTTLHNGTTPSIDLVSMGGTSFSNASVGAPTSGYNFFPPSVSTTATLTQSLTYNLTTNLSGAAIVSVWFDWNQDGVYDASEWTQITTTGTGAITTPIQVPSNASLGTTGMRIRSRGTGNINGAPDACTTFGSGETEEYVITIVAGVSCTGTPTGGNASGPASVCSGTNFTIKDSGATAASGINYQWQSSLDNGATWTDVTGATNASYTGSIADTTWFRYKLTCTSTSTDGYSNVIKVGLNGTLVCSYCSPNNGTTLHSATGPTIESVSISSTSLSNTNAGAPTSGYTQFPAAGSTTATLSQALTYNLITNLSASAIVSVWFDWNQDGTYDSTEWTQITTAGTGIITTPILVPTTSTLGQIGMRVRARTSGATNGAIDACTTFGSGETEEYLLTIVPGTACTGTPSGGVASGPSSVCSGTNITLSDSGAAAALGINYQWQSSLDNGATWTDVTGATNATYTAAIADTTWFRYKVTCTSSSLDGYSNVIKVGLNAALLCAYCGPNNGVTLHGGTSPTLDSVSITGTTLINKNLGAPTGGFTQFTANGNTTAALAQLGTYNLITKVSGSTIASVWIDYDQNGVYDATEWQQITTTGTGVLTTSITIPDTAALGLTGLRIRLRGAGSANGPTNACTQFFSGETEEYFVTIIAPLPIKLSSFTGTHKTIGNVLSWTTLGEQNNAGFKVERSFDGKNFTVVGFVKTSALNGNSSEAINYQFTDEKPFNNSYYRLRQVDKDGKESYSKVIVVKMLNASELSLMSLYPNPAKNIINLVISGNVDEKVTLIITDFAGKIVKTQNVILSNSSNIITLDIAALTSGNYLLKVIGKEGTNGAFGKFFKQ